MSICGDPQIILNSRSNHKSPAPINFQVIGTQVFSLLSASSFTTHQFQESRVSNSRMLYDVCFFHAINKVEVHSAVISFQIK